MSAIKLTIHSTGVGPCSLSGKEGEGVVVTFDDGTLREGFLTHKAFMQLVKMKLSQGTAPAKPSAVATATLAVPVGNGPPK